MQVTAPILIPLSLSLLGACGSPVDSAWTMVAASDLDAPQTSQLDDALGARDALLKGLLGKLMGSLQEVGAAESIAVCSTVAPKLAQDVSAERGLTIGRTSAKLRNPSNTPPDWAESAIDKFGPGEKDVMVEHADGRLGALFPIFVMQPCLACHGSAGELGEGVDAALTRAYPDDQATGYASGDLRGWFWVEVPATND